MTPWTGIKRSNHSAVRLGKSFLGSTQPDTLASEIYLIVVRDVPLYQFYFFNIVQPPPLLVLNIW